MKILILLRKAASRLLGAVLVPSTRTSPTSYLGDSFFDCQRRPKKADEFSCNRHDDFVVLFASTGHAPIAPAQPAMRFVGEGDHACRLSVTAFLKCPAHFSGMPIVPGTLDQNAARVTVTGLGDPTAP